MPVMREGKHPFSIIVKGAGLYLETDGFKQVGPP